MIRAKIRNKGFYAIHDPFTNVVFPPATVTEAEVSVWVKGQPTLEVLEEVKYKLDTVEDTKKPAKASK
jgi:hypothetical protein